jgi:hypothetical protein
MAKENRDWGYDRIAGALANFGYRVCDQTVGNVLHRHGLPPAPERKRTTTWPAFIRTHLALLAGTLQRGGAHAARSSISRAAAQTSPLLFHLISKLYGNHPPSARRRNTLYENTSLLITTAFANWPQVFGDAKMTTARTGGADIKHRARRSFLHLERIPRTGWRLGLVAPRQCQIVVALGTIRRQLQTLRCQFVKLWAVGSRHDVEDWKAERPHSSYEFVL